MPNNKSLYKLVWAWNIENPNTKNLSESEQFTLSLFRFQIPGHLFVLFLENTALTTKFFKQINLSTLYDATSIEPCRHTWSATFVLNFKSVKDSPLIIVYVNTYLSYYSCGLRTSCTGLIKISKNL